MTTFTHFMSDEHHRCDELFATAENAVEGADWVLAEIQHRQFLEAMQRHFSMEEEVLFPAFEEASGSAMGPTTVMRHEHEQLRALFDEMAQALAGQQVEDEWDALQDRAVSGLAPS